MAFSSNETIAIGAKVRSLSGLGKERTSNLLYPDPYSYVHFNDFRMRPTIVEDTEQSVNSWNRRQKLSLSRQMFAQMPILDFALEILCDWAIGEHYDILYKGADQDFASRVEDYSNNIWSKNCTVKGYNLKTAAKLILREVLRDGDLLQVYTFSRSGLPQLQYVRSHRVVQRNNDKTVSGGRFDGYSVVDGLVKNSLGAVIGYYVQDPFDAIDDYVASVKDASLIWLPKYCDYDRGLPPISPAILEALSVQEVDDAIQRRLKLEQLVALKIHNKTGEVPPHKRQQWPQDEDPITPTAATPSKNIGVETMKGGPKYIEYEGDMSTLVSTTPNVEAVEYKADLENKLLSTLGVPHQLIYSPTDISRSPARGISEIFKKNIAKYQDFVEQYIKPAVVWAIGVAIDDGIIAPPSNGEKWWQFIDFSRPAEFTLDAYNEAKQQMDFLKLGLVTRDQITTSRYGTRASEILKVRTQEQVDTWSACIEAKQQLQERYKGNPEALKEINQLSITTMHNGLELMTSNPLPEPVQEEVKPNEAAN